MKNFQTPTQDLISKLTAGLITILTMVLLSSSPAMAQEPAYGIDAKRPVFAGACHYCPYGAIADVVKAAMKNYGYDVQICYRCSTTIGIRQIADKLVPPQPDPSRRGGGSQMGPQEPVPTGAVDFGAVNGLVLYRAYVAAPGRGEFDKDAPRKNLRVFAVVDYPAYTIVAATKASGITDLAQLRGRTKPLHVIVDHHRAMDVLGYYDLSEESIKEAGGSVREDTDLDDPFDLVIFAGTLSNAPEQDIWYTITQKHDLVYLDMPNDLITELVKEPGYEARTIPLGLMRGVDHNVPTIARSDYAIIGRDDAPDEFAYTVAKALDEHSDLWTWAPIPLYYNPHRAWISSDGIPLHPGAEKYYREKGYMK